MAEIATVPVVFTPTPTPTINTSPIPSCVSIPCAPCYISVNPVTLKFPFTYDIVGIRDETYTFNVTAHPTTFLNGSVSTIYETDNRNFSSGTIYLGTRLQESYTWIVPGNSATNLTLTYPTTYLQYESVLAGLSAQPSQTGSTCAQTTYLTNITMPQTADPSSLIAILSHNASDKDETGLPSSIISYLDSLPEIQQQFNDIPLSSCIVLHQQPELCTDVVTSTTKQCTTSTSGNLTRSICTEKTLTRVSTRTFSAAETGKGGPPIDLGLGRIPAAYLTYNTLTLSSEGSGLPGNLLPDAIASPTDPQHLETPKSSSKPALRPNVLSEPAPSEANQSGGDGSPSQPTTTLGGSSNNQHGEGGGDDSSPDTPQKSSQPVVAQSQPGQTSFEGPTRSGPGSDNIQSAIAGLASRASETKADGDHPDGTAGPQTTSGAGLGNLWSAIQSVASFAANSQGAVSTLRSGETPSAERPANTAASPQDADLGNTVTESGHYTNAYTAEAPESTAVVVTADHVPVFTFLGQTLSPGDAATFGGSPISALPSQHGVIIGGSQTVRVTDGSATTISPNGQKPITVSRSGSVLVVNDQTLSAGQQTTVDQTTASFAQSTAVLYVNGAATTLAGPSITLGNTVYTAAPGTSSTGKGLGGYIYSGIGGSVATGGSSDGVANITGVTPFKGSASRLGTWTQCVWLLIMAFWLLLAIQ